MATYTTSSGFSDLNGTVDITNDEAVSYTSGTLGTVKPQDVNGPGLRFNLRFGPGRTYNIRATVDANGYSGTANNNSPLAAEEPWSATASTAAPAEESTAEYEDPTAAEGAAKKAAL
jgi:hypothetical protein